MAYRMAIISVSGGYVEPNVANISKLISDAFNQYTTATSVPALFENPYAMYSDLTEMEKESHGKNYVAANTKIAFLIRQFETLEKDHSYVHVICTTNYLDDIILQYIHNEIQIYAKDKENVDTAKIIENVKSLMKYASETAGLRLPNIIIPANASYDPEKVIYTPIELEIYTTAAKEISLVEIGDYIFPNTPIQITAYLAFGMYNRFMEAISAGMINMYTFQNVELPKNMFATTSPSTMEFFEKYLENPNMKINYTGNMMLTPLHTNTEIHPTTEMCDETPAPTINEDEITEEKATDEEANNISEMPMEDIDVNNDPSERIIEDLPEGDYVND